MFRALSRNTCPRVVSSLATPVKPWHVDVAHISKHVSLSNFMAGRASDPLPADIEAMISGIFRGERRALSKAITLVSTPDTCDHYGGTLSIYPRHML